MEKKYFVHDTAIVDEGAEIGEGSRIWHWCHIMAGVKIGENCNVGEHAFLETGVVLGDNVKVKNNVAIYTGVFCENDVFLGPNCVFTNVINPRSFIKRTDEFKDTIIRKGATIGANATIVCGNEIGKYALVGAGTVVNRDIADYECVVGNPARRIGYVCECGVKLEKGEKEDCYICPKCAKKYTMKNKNLSESSDE